MMRASSHGRVPLQLHAVAVAATFLALMASLLFARPVEAAPSGLSFPAPEGTAWAVLAGYNTATHSAADSNDPYALDLHRTDAATSGTPVLAPICGTVGYASSSCISLRDAARTTVMMCHVLVPSTLRGKAVIRGQRLGTVAPPGEAGNNGVSHIHMAMSNDGPLPFVGNYTIENIALPAITTSNAYADQAFISTTREMFSVDAGPDINVRPGAQVTLNATASSPNGTALSYSWTQISGAQVALSSNGGATTGFVAPPTLTRITLQFRVAVSDGSPEIVSDTVSVNVSTTGSTGPISTPPPTVTPTPPATGLPAIGTPGNFAAPVIYAPSGQAFVVFRGGTVAQLEVAARAANATGVWAQDASGSYQLLIIGGAAFIRDAFIAKVPTFSSDTAVTLVR